MNVRDTVKDSKPYIPGKNIDDVKKEYNLSNVIKLASNENPLGCSSLVKQTILENLSNINIYPDGNASKLRKKLVKKLNIKDNQLIFGAGSDEIITMISQTFINSDDEAIICTPTFPRYASAVKLMGGKMIEVPLNEYYTYDLDGIFKKITSKTKIIFIANPNNPTGTIITADELLKFIQQVPENILIVMDEAYSEYINDSNYPNTLSLLDTYKNIMVLRTFSKVYGLASLRIGYGIASSHIIEFLNRVRGPFNLTTMAQVAALAALDDEEFLNKAVQTNDEVKQYTYKKCNEMNINYIPTYGNFIMIDVKTDTLNVFKHLQSKGIIVRPGCFLGMEGWLRVTLGTKEQMQQFFTTLQSII